jgi:TetR/AcrR family transcriptional repressor of nem operon
MFASDCTTLPESMQEEVKRFYTENEAWLANVLKQGRETGKLNFNGSPRIKAETIFSALEGVMITARLFNDEKRLMSASDWIQTTLTQ